MGVVVNVSALPLAVAVRVKPVPGWLMARFEKVATPFNDRCSVHSLEDRAAGVVRQGDRHGAAAGWIPEAIVDLDGQAERIAGNDRRLRLGLDGEPAGDLVTGEVLGPASWPRRA